MINTTTKPSISFSKNINYNVYEIVINMYLTIRTSRDEEFFF